MAHIYYHRVTTAQVTLPRVTISSSRLQLSAITFHASRHARGTWRQYGLLATFSKLLTCLRQWNTMFIARLATPSFCDTDDIIWATSIDAFSLRWLFWYWWHIMRYFTGPRSPKATMPNTSLLALGVFIDIFRGEAREPMPHVRPQWPTAPTYADIGYWLSELRRLCRPE